MPSLSEIQALAPTKLLNPLPRAACQAHLPDILCRPARGGFHRLNKGRGEAQRGASSVFPPPIMTRDFLL
jgi:hypothetical protein